MATEVVNIDIQVQTKSVGELEAELAKVNEELKSVKIGSQAFKDLSADSQKLTADLEKVNKEIEGFTLDKKIETSQAAVLGLAGGLEATVGTLGLLGVESEVFGKFEEKAISALTAARGFIDLSEGFGKLAKNISFATIKSKIFGITTKQALIATGIGIFAVALGSIIAYWDDIIKGVDKAAEKFPLLGIILTKIENGFNSLIESMRPVLEFFGILPDAAERANNAIIEGNEKVIASNQKEIDVLKAKGATQEEIYAKQEELIMAELDNLKRTDAEKEDIEAKAHELTLLRITEETRKRKQAFDERIKQIQLSETLENERKALEEEWFANFGDEAAMSFTEAFKKTVDEEFQDVEFIDEGFDEVFDGLLGEDGVVTKFRDGLDKALEETLANKDRWTSFFDLASQAFSNIEMLSQQKYERTLLNLQRERDEIINNTNLTEQERIEALARIDAKEKETEIRRIKAERDQFTLKQTLAGLEAIMNAKMFAIEMVQIAKKQVANATATAQEIALAGIAATGKATMSLGAFVAALGPFGIAAFAATIGGVIASIISARKNAKSQIAAISGGAGGGGSAGGIQVGATQSAGLANLEDTSAPQFSGAQPAIRTYVLSGDVTSAQEADSKINKRRQVN